MKSIVLSLGSNIGDRLGNLEEACRLLEERKIRILKTSQVYESEPVGFSDQDAFLNQVLLIETPLTGQEILATCLGVEEHMGRIRVQKNGPRKIDIDLLFYKDVLLSEETLLLPHPQIAERNFILVPLAELIPGDIHPVLGQSIAELLKQSEDRSWVEPFVS